MLRRRAEKWARPAILAALIGLLGLFGKTDLVSDAASALSDRDLLIRWTSTFSGATRSAVPVTLIDVDAEAMALYGSPDRAPRALLAGLLSLAAAKGANGVLLDVDLSRPSPDAAGDAALRETLAAWPAQAPPLALARRFRVGEEGETPEPFAFEREIAGRANIRQAASLALKDSDGVVRRWRLAQTVCENGAGLAYPSPQLIAAAIAAGRAQSDLDRFLDWRALGLRPRQNRGQNGRGARSEKSGPGAGLAAQSGRGGQHLFPVQRRSGRAHARDRGRGRARDGADAAHSRAHAGRRAGRRASRRARRRRALRRAFRDRRRDAFGHVRRASDADRPAARRGDRRQRGGWRAGDPERGADRRRRPHADRAGSVRGDGARLVAPAGGGGERRGHADLSGGRAAARAPRRAVERARNRRLGARHARRLAAAQSLWDIVAGWRSGLRWRVLLKPSTSQAENA
ncbi:MAG: CHASE2 domain-containing protein [Rhodoblastus sp.]|nr:MAG: CHASE2 domain-containing protein [Rhodoblastus sp.]